RRSTVEQVPRPPLQPKLGQRLAAVLRPGHARVGFAVLHDGTAHTLQLLSPPEPVEDPFERAGLLRAAQETCPRRPADLPSAGDVDRRESSGECQFLVDGGGEPLRAEGAPKRDHSVGHPARGLTRPRPARAAHAASRWPPSSGPPPRARSISSATPSRRTCSMSSWDLRRAPSDRSVSSGSTSVAPSAARDSVQSSVSPTPGTR